MVSMALIEYRHDLAFDNVFSNCLRTEQKSDISVPIKRISVPAAPALSAKSNRAMDSFAPAPAMPMILAIAPISAMTTAVGLSLEMILICHVLHGRTRQEHVHFGLHFHGMKAFNPGSQRRISAAAICSAANSQRPATNID